MTARSAIVAVVALAVSSAAAAAARGTTGTLSVSSSPTTAAVYVDGGFIGQTPLNIPNLLAGDHRVRVIKEGYLENSRLVNVEADRVETLNVRLTVRAAQVVSATAGLQIVVIAGEGAVNIIQQKTAVAPVVEVRDRNDVPVGGAVVTFAIGSGKTAAFAGNAQTFTVTTNAAGRAAANQLSPIGAGNVQISVDAAYQGLTAAVSISQVNFVTVAAAKAAGVAVGASGVSAGAGGAAGGGGIGLSATTLGIIGAAAGGGTLIAKKVVGGSGGPTTYKGPFRLEALQSNHQTQGQWHCQPVVRRHSRLHRHRDRGHRRTGGRNRFGRDCRPVRRHGALEDVSLLVSEFRSRGPQKRRDRHDREHPVQRSTGEPGWRWGEHAVVFRCPQWWGDNGNVDDLLQLQNHTDRQRILFRWNVSGDHRHGDVAETMNRRR